ncbi:chorismate synthase [Demequina capsici]|uniref:Chorismate synthase n=1 Tax=Demequina capsici TaxID=3075620 RepID=A0AA96FEE8_9MICO|nr:chorismate synthase [Demequina sp. PMTSA13]WNM28839.1 chorismate synthase [Demequina sp. PMTSA13]
MLRWLTAGESHGPALVGTLEGLPSGVEVTTADVQSALARRRLGYGRGARMAFEQDQVTFLGGVRHGMSQGGPVAIMVGNTEWPKWQTVMSADPVDPEELGGARAAALTRPRPGHADLVGMTKYGFDDARPVLERASARETASRVALGEVAERFLAQAAGIRLVAHTVQVGPIAVPDDAVLPPADATEELDADPIRCYDAETSALMVAEIDACQKDGDTLGGVVEVVAYGVPVGLGSHVHGDRRLDARLAGALMGIQAIKGVEVGDGFRTAARRGSQAHDEIEYRDGAVTRRTNRAGGLEGGMTNGEPLRVRAAMKPISTVPRALDTIDTATGEPAKAIHQRSDVCAVAPAAVVAQAMVALTLADAVLEKFGGDSVDEVRRNIASYVAAIPEHLR